MATFACAGRSVLHSLASLLLLIGVILTGVAITTTEWQYVELTETSQLHLHGLYKDCVLYRRTNQWSCEFKQFDVHHTTDSPLTLSSHSHLAQSWQLAVTSLLSSAAICGLIAFMCGLSSACVDCCGYNLCLRIVAVVWMALTIVASLLSAAGVCYYFKKSFEIGNRIVMDRTESHEQKYGYSFTLAIGGCICLSLSMLLCIAAVVFMCILGKSTKNQEEKTWPAFVPPKTVKISSPNTAIYSSPGTTVV